MHPTTQPRRSTVGRLAWAVFWVLLIVYVMHHPSEAAANARDLGEWAEGAAESIATFLQQSAAGAR